MRVSATRLSATGGNFRRGPSVDPNLTLDLNFLTMSSLDSRVTYTRSGNASVFNSVGQMTTVGANTPRFDYDPVSLLASGILCEAAGANLLVNRATLATESVTVTAAAHTLSFYGAGTVTLSGAFTAVVVGSGAYPSRRVLTFTPTAGTLTLTVTGTCQFGNLELGPRPTSWMPDATRGADVLNLTGTNFTSWYNQIAGTAIADMVYADPVSALSGSTRILTASSGGTSNRTFDLQIVGATNFRTFNGTTNVTTANAPQSGVNRIATAYAANDYALCANAGAVATTTSGTPLLPNRLSIGNLNSTNQPGAWFRRVRYYSTRLPNTELVTLTVT